MIFCFSLMLGTIPLFASVAATNAAASGETFSWIIVMLPAVLVILWFLMMSPQKKQEERMRKMLNSLEKNDKVMTVGGIIATVYAVDKDQNEIVLKVDDANNTKIRFHLTAVTSVFPKEK